VNTTGDRDTVERVVVSDSAGELAVDTDRLAVGTYELRYENGSQFLEFAVADQTIAVTATDSGATETTNVTVVASGTGENTTGIDVSGDGNPSGSVDDDSRHEDVDGDGDVDIADVQKLFFEYATE